MQVSKSSHQMQKSILKFIYFKIYKTKNRFFLKLLFVKSNPDLAKAYEICPFNATHRILGSDKEQHLLDCPDNNLLAQALRNQESKSSRCKVPPVTNAGVVATNDEDDWGKN